MMEERDIRPSSDRQTVSLYLASGEPRLKNQLFSFFLLILFRVNKKSGLLTNPLERVLGFPPSLAGGCFEGTVVHVAFVVSLVRPVFHFGAKKPRVASLPHLRTRSLFSQVRRFLSQVQSISRTPLFPTFALKSQCFLPPQPSTPYLPTPTFRPSDHLRWWPFGTSTPPVCASWRPSASRPSAWSTCPRPQPQTLRAGPQVPALQRFARAGGGTDGGELDGVEGVLPGGSENPGGG